MTLVLRPVHTKVLIESLVLDVATRQVVNTARLVDRRTYGMIFWFSYLTYFSGIVLLKKCCNWLVSLKIAIVCNHCDGVKRADWFVHLKLMKLKTRNETHKNVQMLTKLNETIAPSASSPKILPMVPPPTPPPTWCSAGTDLLLSSCCPEVEGTGGLVGSLPTRVMSRSDIRLPPGDGGSGFGRNGCWF